MKKIISIIGFLVIISFGCSYKNNKLNSMPKAYFDKDTFNFDTAKKGSTVDVLFALKNTGVSDLIIKRTSVGCGCTRVKSLKDTIPPGEIVDIKLIYDSKDDTGKVFKTFVVEANTDPKLHVLYIKGVVE
jgi:Protein of unknown function (DUF1573)